MMQQKIRRVQLLLLARQKQGESFTIVLARGGLAQTRAEIEMGKLLRILVPIFFHLLPIVPFASGHRYFGVAALLIVALPYIKSAKLGTTIRTLEQDPRIETNERGRRELAELRVVKRRWEMLTFLDYGKRLAPQSQS